MTELSPFEAQIRECFGRVVYTHKTHEKQADIFAIKQNFWKITHIIISGVITSGASLAVFFDEPFLRKITAGAAFVGLLVSTYTRNFDFGKRDQEHRDAAASIWNIRESYLSLLTDLQMALVTSAEAVKRRDQLQRELGIIYKRVPQTSYQAYTNAQTALKKLEDFTFSDDEINNFLPVALRKSSH